LSHRRWYHSKRRRGRNKEDLDDFSKQPWNIQIVLGFWVSYAKWLWLQIELNMQEMVTTNFMDWVSSDFLWILPEEMRALLRREEVGEVFLLGPSHSLTPAVSFPWHQSSTFPF
jgi:hypothetical protein